MSKAPKKTKKLRGKPPEFLKHFRDPLDVAAAFSLAHLLFLRLWVDHLIPLENAYFEYTRRNGTWQNIVGLWLAALLLVGPLTLLWNIAIREGRSNSVRLAKVSVVALFLIQLNLIANVMFQNTGDTLHAKNPFFGALSPDALWIVMGESALLLMWVVLKHPQRIVRGIRVLLVLLTPFPFLVSGQVLADALSAKPRNETAAAVVVASQPAPLTRTVVMVFDELDYHLVFDEERLVDYPNFSDFKKHSLSAVNALPPAQNTLLSLPSYWFGANVAALSVKPHAAPQFKFFSESDTRGLASQDHLFAQAARAGANIEIVGWSHPYCELFGNQVARCFQSSYLEPSNGEGVFGSFVAALSRAAHVIKLLGMTEPNLARQSHLDAYFRFKERSLAAVGDASRDLVFLHLPLPHEPVIYSIKTKEFLSDNGVVDESYGDNVALANQLLGSLKDELQNKGLWNTTNVLLVSDHAYRHTDRGESPFDQLARVRVPFLLKPAIADFKNATYTPPFSTRVVGPLALQLLTGKVRTPASVITWLNQNRKADLTFLKTAYNMGKDRCVSYPFTSEAQLFSMETDFEPRCLSSDH